MEKQNLQDTLEQASKDYPTGSTEWYKFKEGDNEMRILTSFAVFGNHFSPSGYKGICLGADKGCQGCKEETKPSAKWLAWIQVEDEVQLIKLSYKVVQQLGEYQNDPDFTFESFPMPYSVNIKAKDAGTIDVVYTVIPRKETPVDPKILAILDKNDSPVEIVEAMKDKKKKGSTVPDIRDTNNYPKEDIDPKDIPF